MAFIFLVCNKSFLKPSQFLPYFNTSARCSSLPFATHTVETPRNTGDLSLTWRFSSKGRHGHIEPGAAASGGTVMCYLETPIVCVVYTQLRPSLPFQHRFINKTCNRGKWVGSRLRQTGLARALLNMLPTTYDCSSLSCKFFSMLPQARLRFRQCFALSQSAVLAPARTAVWSAACAE